MNSDNPFSSPIAEDSIETSKPIKSEASFGSQAKAIFLAWEKLRIVYNLVLAVLTLLMGIILLGEYAMSIQFWVMVVQGAIISNVCFFAGPIVETYVCWIGFRFDWLRTSLFVLGLLFTALAAAATIASMGFAQLPNQ